jgi:Histidine kinase-, DNA gyrase B-, and HSP90-like ATPase
VVEDGLFNLTPSPRVLRMLGRIDFKPWQCIAELVDNAVDAFLNERELVTGKEGSGVLFPQVNVELSAAAEVRAGRGEMRVTDNGPGMAPEFLEDALRAGFSANDSADKLGLFGMGFNVATARLGSRTEVWTTRHDDDSWSGVRIDFDEMEASRSFQVPSLRRPKLSSEADAHGTQVVISKLDQERALYLRSGGGLHSTRGKLSRVYNKIMREIGLEVVVVGTPLVSRPFCHWGRTRFVETKGELGRVPAFIGIDEDLGARPYCEDCWIWLSPSDEVCPVCGKRDRIRMRDRKVTGWLGVQRFFDHDDYGVDLVRNGRVIEERSKVFFQWRDPETDEAVAEYPLEQTHWGGRIVGELNLDFVPLASHQKDAFDKSSAEWRLAAKVVRGEGPIVQKYRRQLGMADRNYSPLARLHGAYRRGQPAGLRTLVPGDGTTGRGFNVKAQQWAALFWEGDPDYQTDDRWYQAVLEAEEVNSRKKGAAVPTAVAGDDAFPSDDEDEDRTPVEAWGAGGPPPPPVLERVEDPALSGDIELPEIPGAPRLDVTAEKLVRGVLDEGKAIRFAAVGSRVEFVYDPRHSLFAKSLVEPADCLVEELGYQILVRSSVTQAEFPLSTVIALLRARYFPWTIDSYEAAHEEALALIAELIEFFTEALAPLAGQHSGNITESERRAIALAVALIDHQGEERVIEVIETGEYPRYLGPQGLPGLVGRWPELVMDGQFFSNAYLDLEAGSRGRAVAQVVGPLNDVLWAANPDGPQAGGAEWRNLLGRAVSSLRLLQGWKVGA